MQRLLFVSLLLLSTSLMAELPGVREWQIQQPLEKTYKALYESLENNRFWVVFEANISSNLEGFAKKWGDDYNQNKLEGIRSMVFCNGWYANQVSNKDPRLLAICPLRITLTHKEGTTSILFVRPTYTATESDAMGIAKELEDAVAIAVEEGIIKAESD